MEKKFDFGGWATRNDLKCSDGRTIRKDAFKQCDGTVVPLVWNHQHDESFSVLGHALLENRKEGVYAYCSFNDTEAGQNSKRLVQHGDVTALSIYANQLKQKGGDVLHGAIREVSLVLAGANPGAFIDSILSHGVDSDEEAEIRFVGDDYNLDIYHSEENYDDEEEEEVIEHADENPEEKEKAMGENEKTVQDVWESMTDEQKRVCEFIVGQALADAGVTDEEGDAKEMNHNVFENDYDSTEFISHSDMVGVLTSDWKRCGSLAEAFKDRFGDGELMHAVQDANGQTVSYGVANIDYLFPEAKTLGNEPEFIRRNTDWVGIVMNGVHRSPFSRIKSVFANITVEEARALGYIKGKVKKEEVFPLLKRTTTPTTVYKKQKLDKDDILDITDFDMVAWLKKEMRIMLDEELARAYLIGDGRALESDDHIDEAHVRPVWKDDDLYTIHMALELDEDATNDDKVNAVIDAVITADEDYEGSGNKTMFVDKWFLTRAMLMRNTIGERMYKSVNELASEMDVNKIVTVPVFKNQKREVSGRSRTLVAVVVDLNDYNVGSDHGGPVNFFDDFDIDRNQEKYLIETRCSGALIRPKSAIAVEFLDPQ